MAIYLAKDEMLITYLNESLTKLCLNLFFSKTLWSFLIYKTWQTRKFIYRIVSSKMQIICFKYLILFNHSIHGAHPIDAGIRDHKVSLMRVPLWKDKVHCWQGSEKGKITREWPGVLIRSSEIIRAQRRRVYDAQQFYFKWDSLGAFKV